MQTPEQILEQLKRWVAAMGHHNQGDVFIEELCFVDKGRRADLVHANGRLTAFEIKSSADTLARWEGQQQDYLSCFDEVWLACHTRHLVKAIANTAPVVGIILVDDYAGMAVARTARPNKSLDAFRLTGFLWRSELERLAKEYEVPISRKDLLREVRRKVSDALDLNVIRGEVLRVLKNRYSD